MCFLCVKLKDLIMHNSNIKILTNLLTIKPTFDIIKSYQIKQILKGGNNYE